MLKKQIQQICEDCASKMFLEIVPDTVYSAWEDECDVCHQKKEVADIYDYTPINEKR